MYNNPGNIRYNPAIPGVIGKNEKGFSIFGSEQDGLRAIMYLLNLYYTKYNLTTIKGIINRYAPPIENQTSAYAQFVSNRSGFGLDQKLSKTDLWLLIKPMVKMESGKDLDNNYIAQAIGVSKENPASLFFAGLIAVSIFGLILRPK